MAAIITSPLRTFSVLQNKEAYSEFGSERLYVFIGRQNNWTDEDNPPVPAETAKTLIDAYHDMIGMKLISGSNMITVCRRFDWIHGTVYDMYDDTVNMTNSFSIEDNEFPMFYALTDEFNVYKCLGNNNGAPSTVKPTGTSIYSFETADGYIWKYMYSLNSSDVFNFLDDNWMPVKTLKTDDGSTQWQIQSSAIQGTIESVVVTSSGAGYNPMSPPPVSITGDGTGASAIAVVNPETGGVSNIRMTSLGSGYTNATVTISSEFGGAGASARAIMSPIGGHGSDPMNELGGYFLMVVAKIFGDEDGKIPTDVSFRQIGLIHNPKSNIAGVRINLSDIAGVFDNGDQVSGSSTLATGTVVTSNIEDGYVDVLITSGAFLIGETLLNDSCSGVISSIQPVNLDLNAQSASIDDIVYGTGKILYLENRRKITRSVGQNELIKFVIEG